MPHPTVPTITRAARAGARSSRALATAALAGFVLASVGALLSSPLAAQGGGRSAAILILRGSDTLVVERVQRSDGGVTAEIAIQGQPRIALRYTLGADGMIPAATFTVRGAGSAPDAPPLQSGTLEFKGDSALLAITAGGNTRNIRVATRAGALPIMNNDFVVLEQAVRIARAKGVTRLTVPLFALSNAQTIDGTLELVGGDSARFTVAGNVTETAIDAAGNVTGGVLPAQGMRIAVVEGAAAAAISLGKPDYSAPAGAPYSAEEVTVPTPAGHRLTGTLTRPAGAAGRLPAVVTITGSGAQDRDEYIPVAGGYRPFRQVADTLGRRGIAVLRLDDRGVGGSGGDVNGTSADFADDIRAAVAFLRARADIDPARIALVGHSEGAMIAPMVAVTDSRLAGIVLMAGPAYNGRQIIDYQIANGVQGTPSILPAARDSAVKAARAEFDSTTARGPWMRFFLTYEPLPTAQKVRQPVLILQGATDQQIRAEEAAMLEKALRAGGNRAVTSHVFADRNHLFLRDADGHPSGYMKLTDPKMDAEVLGVLADWLATTLRAR
ncbi:MAG: alpha/beta fold hydrolase [Gemmatimonadetes bacterium]|nr:alpha/beta fold hydrolase [Gemmatimonadota bacterium]